MRLEIPKHVHDLNIRDYKRILSLQEIEDQQKRSEQLIAYLTGITINDVRQLTVKSYHNLADAVIKMQPVNKSYPLEKFWKHEGVEYGFIPNLETMTVGEWADLNAWCDSTYDNLEHVMSVLYRPIKSKSGMFYSIEPYNGSKPKVFEHMPIRYALGAVAFFFDLGLVLLLSISNSSKEETEAQSQKSGDGTAQSTI